MSQHKRGFGPFKQEKRMRKIDTFRDLVTYVSECNPDTVIENYDLDREELDEAIAKNLLDMFVQEFEFQWGDELPSIDEERFNDLLEKYATKENDDEDY
jgi:hypothetical protein